MTEQQERSVSRGRDFVSTGRGGAGNLVRNESASRTRVSRERDGDERGRELPPSGRVTHTGRGGAGNVRSPSRDPNAIQEEMLYERQVIDASRDPEEAVTFSTGRGGVGNMKISPNTSVSRERDEKARSVSRDPPSGKRFTSSGRGGRGNIHYEGSQTQRELEKLDEDDRVAAGGIDSGKLHSTGRGGAGNLTTGADGDSYPTAEVLTEDGIHSTGKGGYGNITHAYEANAALTGDSTEGRGRSGAKHPNGLGGVWDKVTQTFGHK